MSPESTTHPDGSQQPYRRLKLVMSAPKDNHLLGSTDRIEGHVIKEESSRGSSPARPSYSPVTPTLSHSSLNGQDTAEAEWIDEPDPLPVSLDDNPDAIALQATLSLLQMQRQQSLRDIRGLNRMKQEALESPEAFVEDLKKGKLSQPAHGEITFDPDTDESDVEQQETSQQDRPRFGKLPTNQSIARCPPIEWSKYRVAGEPLERLHELQRQHPGVREEALAQRILPEPHEITTPYRPFTDRIQPRSTSSTTRNYDS